MSVDASIIVWILAISASIIFLITVVFAISDLNKNAKKREEILKKLRSKQIIQKEFEF
jgi:hypothetical protein